MPDGEAGNDPVARATARAAVLRAEIEQRNEELKRLEIYLAVHHDLFDPPGKVDQISRAETAPIFPNKTVRPRKRAPRMFPPGISQAQFTPFVRDMILEHGRPMFKAEIRDGFKRMSRHIGGNPEFELKNLYRKLARAKKDIKHISGAGYWPIDVPCPEVGYVPP